MYILGIHKEIDDGNYSHQEVGKQLRYPYTQGTIREIGIQPDDMVEIRSEAGHLTVTPVKKTEYSLEELLAQMTPENLHDEVQTGRATGAEVW